MSGFSPSAPTGHPFVNVTWDRSGKEITKVGYAQSLYARNVAAYVERDDGSKKYERAWPSQKFLNNVWVEPIFGYLKLRPSIMTERFFCADEQDELWLQPTGTTGILTKQADVAADCDWCERQIAWPSKSARNATFITMHETAMTGLIDRLAGMASSKLGHLDPSYAYYFGAGTGNLVTMLRSKLPLHANESFMIRISVDEAIADKFVPIFSCTWGQKWAIVVGTSGDLYVLYQETPNAKYHPVASWGIADVLAKHNAIWLLVTPVAEKYIGFYWGPHSFAALQGNGFGSMGRDKPKFVDGFVVQVARNSRENSYGINEVYDSDHLEVHVHDLANVAFDIARVRFPGVGTVHVGLDRLPGNVVNPIVPVDEANQGFVLPGLHWKGALERGTVSLDAIDEHGNAFVAGGDYLGVKVTMTSGIGYQVVGGHDFSTENLFSPEIALIGKNIEPLISTVAGADYDASNDWTELELVRRNENDRQESGTIKFGAKATAETNTTTGSEVPVKIVVECPFENKSFAVFDGYATNPRIHYELPKKYGEWQLIGAMHRLGDRTLENMPVFDGHYLDELIVWGLKAYGYPASEIVVSAEVQQLIPLPPSPNEFKTRMENASFKDVLDDVLKKASDVQLRRVYAETTWVSYDGTRSPSTTPYTNTDVVWYVYRDVPHKDLMLVQGSYPSFGYTNIATIYLGFPYADIGTSAGSDATRFSTRPFKLFGELAEEERIPPEFNVLLVEGQSGSSEGASRVVSARIVNTPSISDSSNRDYIRRAKEARISAEDSKARTLEEANIVARIVDYYAGHREDVIVVNADWRPAIREGHHVKVYYRRDDNKLDSLGWFRIEELALDLNAIGYSAGTWRARYTLKWRGADSTPPTPVDVNEPTGGFS